MKLHEAKALAEREAANHPGCTIHLCAAFKPWNPDALGFNLAEVNQNGYSTCDFFDSSVIASITDGKWRPV